MMISLRGNSCEDSRSQIRFGNWSKKIYNYCKWFHQFFNKCCILPLEANCGEVTLAGTRHARSVSLCRTIPKMAFLKENILK